MCHLLGLLGAQHIFYVSRLRVVTQPASQLVTSFDSKNLPNAQPNAASSCRTIRNNKLTKVAEGAHEEMHENRQAGYLATGNYRMQTLHGRVHCICSWPAAPTHVYSVSRSGNLGEKETQDQAGSQSGLRPLAVHRLFLFLICYIPRCVLCSNRRLLFLVRLHSCLPLPPPPPTHFFNQAVSM